MDPHALLIFAATYALACVFPGPTVTALVARVRAGAVVAVVTRG
jgi:threonine/homoserine/homoserine lactone efflux protein